MLAGARELPVVNILGSAILVMAFVYWARAVLIPLALAVLLTCLLHPVVTRLQRLGLSRVPSVLLVVLLASALLGGIGWVVMGQLTTLAHDLPQYESNIKRKIADLHQLGKGGVIERVQRFIQDIAAALDGEQPDARPPQQNDKPIPVVVQPPSVLWQLPSLFDALANAGLVVVLVIFMLIDHADLRNRLIRLAGYGRLTLATRALDEVVQRISRYLQMQSIINGSYGIALALGYFLIGVPYAFFWGFLAATLRFIPYVGPVLAAAFPIVLSLAAFDGWVQPLLVISLVLILELVSNGLLEPLLYGQSTGVSEVALMVAIAFWTWLWGPVGLLLATPLTVCVSVLGRYVPQLEFLKILLADEPVLEAHAAYYQRLLAKDQDEAAAIVDDALRAQALDAVYDQVLIPALVVAKRDREQGALAAEDLQYIVQATRAIIEDVGAQSLPRAPAPVTDPPGDAADALQPPVPILGCPARDEVDELALLMFRQLLEPSRYMLEVVSAEVLTAAGFPLVEQHRAELVCIAALPPGATARTRSLCKQLRAR
jgi:predicted PurR-regulated permease PerM